MNINSIVHSYIQNKDVSIPPWRFDLQPSRRLTPLNLSLKFREHLDESITANIQIRPLIELLLKNVRVIECQPIPIPRVAYVRFTYVMLCMLCFEFYLVLCNVLFLLSLILL